MLKDTPEEFLNYEPKLKWDWGIVPNTERALAKYISEGTDEWDKEFRYWNHAMATKVSLRRSKRMEAAYNGVKNARDIIENRQAYEEG